MSLHVSSCVLTQLVPPPDLAKIIKKQLEQQKKRAAAMKEVALANVKEAVAQAPNRKYLVLQTVPGVDARLLSEAWAAVKNDVGALMVLSSDPAAGRVSVLGGVADGSALDANEWTRPVLEVLGGKGGGKKGVCMGNGTAVDKVDDALALAEKLAAAALG